MTKVINKIKKLQKALNNIKDLSEELDMIIWNDEVLKDEASKFSKIIFDVEDAQQKVQKFMEEHKQLLKWIDK